MDNKKKYIEVEKWMKETTVLSSIGGLLAWDQETMLPPKGMSRRAEQAVTLASVIHEKFVDPKMGNLLRSLANNSLGLSSMQKANVRERLRDYEKSITLPSELVKKLAQISSLAQSAWIEARKKSKFKDFEPWLKRMFDLKREQAEAYGYRDSPYDPLLDDYEPKMTVKILDPVIDDLKKNLIPIAQAIRESEVEIDEKILRKKYDLKKQEKVCREIMKTIGVDSSASRLDISAHPFCAGIYPPDDVRITTRFDENYLIQSISAVIHESGHALYEQGMNTKYIGTPMAESLSIGIHESQSRFWENLIGRSRPFVKYLLPKLKKEFPDQLKSVDTDTFYLILNKVKPTLIRIDADEVHYNLHVILRYEIEKDLIEGNISVRDLPDIWNSKVKHYLGIEPENDAEGVLQDTHWALGLIGYFPTYLLGNLFSSQFWDKLVHDIKNTDKYIAKGNFQPILTWLRTNIHSKGRMYSANELIKKVTGKKFSSKFFTEYLKEKYGKIYKITW